MAERRPLILDETGMQRELPAGDSLVGVSGGSSVSVPIDTVDFVVNTNTSAVAVDTLSVTGSLLVDGNLGVL